VIVPMRENQLTTLLGHGRMESRMFSPEEGRNGMTTRMHAAANANGMAADARVRAYQPCPATSAVVIWSPISLGTTTDKHGRPRRPEVSHQ
jgi:hypothetical protein